MTHLFRLSASAITPIFARLGLPYLGAVAVADAGCGTYQIPKADINPVRKISLTHLATASNLYSAILPYLPRILLRPPTTPSFLWFNYLS